MTFKFAKITAPADTYMWDSLSYPGIELTDKVIAWSRAHGIWLNVEYEYYDEPKGRRVEVRLLFKQDVDAIFFALSYE